MVAGFGELLGYGLRLFSGPLGDRTGRFWSVAWVGYVVQMTAVPLLALAGSWQVAALLIIAERVGKVQLLALPLFLVGTAVSRQHAGRVALRRPDPASTRPKGFGLAAGLVCP